MKKILILMMLIVCFTMNIEFKRGYLILGETKMLLPKYSKNMLLHSIDFYKNIANAEAGDFKSIPHVIDVRIKDSADTLKLSVLELTNIYALQIKAPKHDKTWTLTEIEVNRLKYELEDHFEILGIGIL